MASRLLAGFGIDPRGFFALTRTLILMDLRGQHYARATAHKPHYVISPLFWVVGQCLTLSASASLFLFARVDVFLFAFVGMALSMIVMASSILVEFNEIVLDPRDLDILGHRPVSPRTYAAARFANLLFYVGLMYVALNLFPCLVGAGLRDAGPWYAPAYLAASFAGNLAVVAAVILALSIGGASGRLEQWKEILAWTQIALVLVTVYGGQLMLRDRGHAIQLWGAFPPTWSMYLPPTWLARFVEEAAVDPSGKTLQLGLLLFGVALIAGIVSVWRVTQLYRTMQPIAVSYRVRPMPGEHIGTLKVGLLLPSLTRSAEERVGFWLCLTFLRRDGGLRMRCLWPLNLAIAVILLGLISGQFANPLVEGDPERVTLPILAVYLIALAVPPIIYNLTFTRDSEAAWVFRGAPLDRSPDMGRGTCKAVMVIIVTPLCLLFGIAAAVTWGYPLSAALHAALAWGLSWLLALTSLWLVVPDYPFSAPAARGGSFGPLAVPMAILSAVMMTFAGLHYLFASSPWFWAGAGLICVASVRPLAERADARLAQLWEAQA